MKKLSGHIVDVRNQRIYDGIIEVENGIISKITESMQVEDQYILPGFIDAHVHIESSMLLPENFALLASRHGTVGVVTDPHEIANVLGVPGVEFMIENSRKAPFHFCFCAPSCVPSTDCETAGARINADDIAALMRNPDIYALAEMMNFPGVLFDDPEVLRKIDASRAAGKPVDGHAPGLLGDGLQKYISTGISTDHECTTLEEAEARLKLGMKVLIREGSAAHDFEALSPLLQEHNGNLMFCSDDKHPDELVDGHINLLVKRALKKGYPLWNVLRAACVTPVEHYGIPCGLLQAGDSADFIVVDNIADFNVLRTYIAGTELPGNVDNAELDKYYNGEISFPSEVGGEWPNNFHAKPISVEDLKVEPLSESMRVIVAANGSLLTGMEIVKPLVENGNVVSDIEHDVLKLVVYNRYTPAKPQVAFIKGFGLKEGALGSTIAHDSHNIIAVGTSDEALVAVVNQLIEIHGGISVCEFVEGKPVFKSLSLPVAGLISPCKGEEVAYQFDKIAAISFRLGCEFEAPFMTLGFMALPVIPTLKLTDIGLFDGEKFAFTELFVK